MTLSQLEDFIEDHLPLTLGEVLEIADKSNVRPKEVVIKEAQIQTGKTSKQVLEDVWEQFQHNFKAIDIGLTSGKSLLFGKIGAELSSINGPKLAEDDFIDKVLMYTLAAQVGNHTIGIRPCAGTGDSCPYTGFIKAMIDSGYHQELAAGIAGLILKIGSIFRVGKISTGCNMEGFGAGAAAMAAAFVELKGGNPRAMEKAMVLAISPTIAVPCTPRVMVEGLCATHIGGAVLIGDLAANLALKTGLEVNVPVDVMISMASEIHPISAQQIVPAVVEFMEPFFKTKPDVEKLVDEDVKQNQKLRIEQTITKAREISKKLARNARPITETLGEAVVGGSSQAVGSPTNTARIAHYLAKGNIKNVKIELYPELFTRRGISVPGILMAAVFGSSTSDYKMYDQVMEKVKQKGIKVEIQEIEEHQAQKITIETDELSSSVDALNRGGGRLVLREATPSREKALEIAQKLGITVVNP